VVARLWLSGAHLGRTEAVYIGPVPHGGRLAWATPWCCGACGFGGWRRSLASGNWVEADLKIYAGRAAPAPPAVIAASASLFGEWAASLVPVDQAPNDPNIRQASAEAQARRRGGSKMAGRPRSPTIGQLTAQRAASRPTLRPFFEPHPNRPFDSTAVTELRRSIRTSAS